MRLEASLPAIALALTAIHWPGAPLVLKADAAIAWPDAHAAPANRAGYGVDDERVEDAPLADRPEGHPGHDGVGDWAGDRVGGRTGDLAAERAGDRAAGRTGDRVGDRAGDRVAVRTADRAGDRANGQGTPDLLIAAGEISENPQYYEQVYLTRAQALKIALPPSDEVITREFEPTAQQRKAIEKRLGRKLAETSYTFFVSRSGGKPTGYALILDEQGKYYPITFIVGLAPDGTVREVAIMVYREKRGDAVKRRRFLNQFLGKSARDPLMVNRDIIHLTGATVSSWSIAAGVKKATVLFDELIGTEK